MVFKRRGHEFEAINFLGFNNLQLLKLQLPLGRSYFHLNCISAVHIIFILWSFLSRVKWTRQTLRQCIGLHSSVGRALQRQRRGHGFESRWSHSHQNLIFKGVYQYPEFILIVYVNTKTLFADHYQLRESNQNKRAALRCTVRSSGIIFSEDEEQHDRFFLPAAIWKKKPAHWHFYVRWRWTRLIPIVGFSQVVKNSWSLSGIYTVRCKISTSLLRENAAQLIFL